MNCRGVGADNSSWKHPLIIKNNFFKKNISKGLNSFRTGEIFKKTFLSFTATRYGVRNNHLYLFGGDWMAAGKGTSIGRQ